MRMGSDKQATRIPNLILHSVCNELWHKQVPDKVPNQPLVNKVFRCLLRATVVALHPIFCSLIV